MILDISAGAWGSAGGSCCCSGGWSILGIAPLVKWLWPSNGAGAKSKTALDIFQERYARGEIDREEYERIKRDLQG